MVSVETILRDKRDEIARLPSVGEWDRRSRPPHSFRDALARRDVSVIAEIKRSSPSTGSFDVDVDQLLDAYLDAGVDALSILTDRHFGMTRDDLARLGARCSIPILRKDFILSREQIDESHAVGADAILLIATFLGERELDDLGAHARSLRLDVLYEAHSAEEIKKIPSIAEIVGVNNRDLSSAEYRTDMNLCRHALAQLPVQAIKVAESGYGDAAEIPEGYNAVLIGGGLIREFKKTGSVKAMVARIKRGLRRS